MDDPDGDLYSNMAEYCIGTDPTNRASAFAITQQLLPTGHIVLHWSPVVSNHDYTVLRSSSPGNSFHVLKADIPYPGNCWTDTVHSAAAAGFYLIDIRKH